jgi:hypothetical protein
MAFLTEFFYGYQSNWHQGLRKAVSFLKYNRPSTPWVRNAKKHRPSFANRMDIIAKKVISFI